MTVQLRLQSKICTMCQKESESPYNSQWNALTNEKIILCSRDCFVEHMKLCGYDFYYKNILKEIQISK